MTPTPTLEIRVLFFASAADATGRDEVALTLPDGATVGAAVDQLCDAFPALAGLRNSLATAVNLSYVGPGHALHGGDELALIPPVSGG